MAPFDDTLLQLLHGGGFDLPLWDRFLRQLLARTGARHAYMMFRSPEGGPIIESHARDRQSNAIRRKFGNLGVRDPLSYVSMRCGRVYAFEDLLDPLDPVHAAFQREILQPQGLTSLRVIRETEPGGVDVWLACSGDRRLGSAAGALLTALSPHLRIALRGYVALERERLRSEVTGQAVERLSLGWIALDARCSVIEASPQVEEMFRSGTLLRRGRYDRLVPASPEIDRRMTALVRSWAAGEDGRPRAFTLDDDPWCDMLVTPAAPRHAAGGIAPTAIVYVSGDRSSQADRCEQLIELFGMLPSEARLAWMLAQGTSIAASAEALGLTVETARNYSKKIYAKTGARGQAELVRIVLTSVLAIS